MSHEQPLVLADHVDVGTTSALWTYPAKSMQGHQVSAAEFDDRGMIGDRSWAVRDEVRGGIRGAKQLGQLMNLSARFSAGSSRPSRGDPITITTSSGEKIRSDDHNADERLSRALDHRVTLHPLAPVDHLEHYRRGRPDSEDLETELRAVFARTHDEPLPDFTDFGHVVEFESPPGTYVDAYPVHILTTTSLATLEQLNPSSTLDVRRFRPNIVLSDDGAPGTFPEQDWIGSVLSVGDAEFKVVAGSPRCVMVTRGFDELPPDRPLLRSIVKDASQVLGVYATVMTAGRIRTGDHCTLRAQGETQ